MDIANESSKFYYSLVGMLYTLYAITFLGIYYVNPEYINYLSIFIRFFVAIILIIRFNSLHKIPCNSSDRILITASAFFILIDMGVTEVLLHYLNIVRQTIAYTR
jgi:hypothetical protein